MKQCGSSAKGFVELNQLKGAEQTNCRDGDSKDGNGLSEEDESRISKDNGGGKCKDIILAGTDSRSAYQQPQGSNIRWDRIIPIGSIKVLLVENDESTRHVVSALLRNCSYEVTAVANGMQAWEILEGTSIQVDIVLTELTIPVLSGMSLLRKIKEHRTHKNMPVIIMSSHDSMGVVFKCLSKGAVDFLVKPIRKNELKNLWQHVWRKLNYSSGSGSGKQTKELAKSIGAEESNNNDSSDIGDDNGSTGLNNRDGSDHGSGTESCWDRNRIEYHHAPPILTHDQSTSHISSISAQATGSMAEAFASNWKPVTTKKFRGIDSDTTIMGKDLEMGCRTIATLWHEEPCGDAITTACNDEKVDRKTRQVVVDCDMENDGPSAPTADLMSLIAKYNVAPEVTFSESPNGFMAGETNGKALAFEELPSLELSLKQVGDGRNVETDDHTPIRRSGFSAFTRYYSMASTNETPSGNVGSCSPPDNSSEAAKGESTHDLQSKSGGVLLKQSSNGSTDNNDKGSTTSTVPINSFNISSDTRVIPTTSFNHPTSAFKRVGKHNSHALQPTILNKGDMTTSGTFAVQEKEMNQQTQVHLLHQYADNMQLHQKRQKNQDDCCANEVSISGGGMKGDALVRNVSGQAEKNVDINPANMPIDSDRRSLMVGGVGKSVSGIAGIAIPSRLDALNKYRQKKRERCFRKKVRYQSRKQLAEQRPRVKGQFVRQAVHNNNARDQISRHELSL
uniref:Uncharacterized protein n=1 Tax=Kalanchoe fedtschenkoi TaxID=63787 RepID=A0A7N1A4Y1_KALFE